MNNLRELRTDYRCGDCDKEFTVPFGRQPIHYCQKQEKEH